MVRVAPKPAWRRYAAMLVVAATAFPAATMAQDRTTLRQRGIQWVLTSMDADTLYQLRTNCVAGDPALGTLTVVNATAGGFALTAAELCVTVLTRLGRDGTLSFVRDARGGSVTPAVAFDAGFVASYRKGGAIDRRLPTIGALRPVAERCLAQKERDNDVCYAAGQAFGVRAYNGETVPIR